MIERSSCMRMQTPVRVLAATPNDRHYQALETAISGTGWALFQSRNIVEALSSVINHQIEVIFTDCHLPDGSWREMIQALQACRNAPRVIVFSAHADDRLWMEVLHCGGYDLVATPFNREEISRVGYRAWLSWQKRARGLRSVWFPVNEPEPGNVREVGRRHAAEGLRS